MALSLRCPCGELIIGENDDELVEKTQAHLAEFHPGMEYDRESILLFAI